MRCEDCKWWVKLRKKRDELQMGQYRRYPPSIPCQKIININQNSCYPILTLEEYWCGEFQHKEESK